MSSIASTSTTPSSSSSSNELKQILFSHNASFDQLLTTIPPKFFFRDDDDNPAPSKGGKFGAPLTKAQKKAVRKLANVEAVKNAKMDERKKAKRARVCLFLRPPLSPLLNLIEGFYYRFGLSLVRSR